jgi:hypothetical protein
MSSLEKESLLAETKETLNLVSQDSKENIIQLQKAGKSRSANELIKATHRVALTLLTFKFLVFYFKLPTDIQEKIRDFIKIKCFREWYHNVVTRQVGSCSNTLFEKIGEVYVSSLLKTDIPQHHLILTKFKEETLLNMVHLSVTDFISILHS